MAGVCGGCVCRVRVCGSRVCVVCVEGGRVCVRCSITIKNLNIDVLGNSRR